MSQSDAKRLRKQARKMVGAAGLDALTQHRIRLNELALVTDALGRELTGETAKLRDETSKLRADVNRMLAAVVKAPFRLRIRWLLLGR